MNKTLAITAITLVAVVMGLSSVAPAIAIGSVVHVELCFTDINERDKCILVLDSDGNGCDPNDRRITVPASVASHLTICPLIVG